jgi:hypothetical protein
MNLEAVGSNVSAGDPYCPTHGMSPCVCGMGVLPNTGDWTSPGSVPVPYVPYNPNTFTISIPVPECAFCDKPLEADDKKLCKDCRGVFEAWKFLTKKDEPDKEPEGG